MANLKNTVISDTVFRLPTGDTAARPASPAARQLRFNTDTGELEQFRPGLGAWIAPSNTGVIAAGGDAVYDVETEGTTYRVHVFTSTGTSTFEVLQGGEAEYLIVAGGGGGGSRRGGGGGAGGLITGFISLSPGIYDIVVGSGGLGLVTNTSNGIVQQRSNGGNSSAFGLTAIGGGAGGHYSIANANSGGSGAGGSGSSRTAGASGTAGQGNSGGNGVSGEQIGAGGGGAGGAGENGLGGGTSGKPGDGGIGIASSITGTNLFYAGGGAGGRGDGSSYTDNRQIGAGGLGGGGAGGNNSTFPGPGAPNTGGGGGACGGSHGVVDESRYGISQGAAGENGGSGIVVIRYPLRQNNPETAAGQDVGDGLVLDLDFAKPTVYNGSGSVVTDSRLNGIEGDFVNSPDFQDARTHRSNFRFPGNQRATLSSTLEQKLDGNPEATLIMWLKLDSVTAGTGNNGLIQLSAYTSSNGNLYPWGSNSRIYLDIFRTNRLSTNVNLSGIGTFWHMLTVTTQPGSNGWKMYLNNNLEYQNTGQSVVSVDSSLFNGFTIGRSSSGRNLLGNIGLVRIHNVALSSAQVNQFYEATRWRFGV